jgi:hypothetical protein
MISKELKKLKKAIQYQPKPKKKQTIEDKQDKILWNWVRENYGRRCSEFNSNCATCNAWRMYDYLKMGGKEIRTYDVYWINRKTRTNKLTIKL